MNKKIKYYLKNPEILEKVLDGMGEEAIKLFAEITRLRAALKEIYRLANSHIIYEIDLSDYARIKTMSYDALGEEEWD